MNEPDWLQLLSNERAELLRMSVTVRIGPEPYSMARWKNTDPIVELLMRIVELLDRDGQR